GGSMGRTAPRRPRRQRGGAAQRVAYRIRGRRARGARLDVSAAHHRGTAGTARRRPTAAANGSHAGYPVGWPNHAVRGGGGASAPSGASGDQGPPERSEWWGRRSTHGGKIVVAPDKFKGSLTAAAAAEAMRLGVLDAAPDADVVAMPVADGGEGTVDAFLAAG